jgi:hypothetical protein
LPWRIEAALDRHALRWRLAARRLLGVRASAELEALLRQRVSEARDLFAQRGVRPRRDSVLDLAGRSIAADFAAIARIHSLVARIGEETTPRTAAESLAPIAA